MRAPETADASWTTGCSAIWSLEVTPKAVWACPEGGTRIATQEGMATGNALPRSQLPRGRSKGRAGGGRVIGGRYHLGAMIGEGGIGRVYEAYQPSLGRKVAIKTIRPERRSDAVTTARFLREARVAGSISSPHIVTLFDSGKDGEELYIAMELLEGMSLAERLSEGIPLTMAEALETAAAIARGLEAAHSAGILHRDLKPANVFLTRTREVKVLDFGIAKIIEPEKNGDWEQLTEVNRILGTPVYMSPEAATREPMSPASDLYALGLLLFEMIVGEPPFRTGDAIKTLREQVEKPAPRLSESAPWVAIPEELDRLVAALLSKHPENRPQRACDVARELENMAADLRAGRTVLDTPEPFNFGGLDLAPLSIDNAVTTPSAHPGFDGHDNSTELWTRPFNSASGPPIVELLPPAAAPARSKRQPAPRFAPPPMSSSAFRFTAPPPKPSRRIATGSIRLDPPPIRELKPGRLDGPSNALTHTAMFSQRQLAVITAAAALLAFGTMILIRLGLG